MSTATGYKPPLSIDLDNNLVPPVTLVGDPMKAFSYSDDDEGDEKPTTTTQPIAASAAACSDSDDEEERHGTVGKVKKAAIMLAKALGTPREQEARDRFELELKNYQLRHPKRIRAGTVGEAYAKNGLSQEKACQILHDKSVRGHPLTDRQRRMMGARCHPSSSKRSAVSKKSKKF